MYNWDRNRTRFSCSTCLDGGFNFVKIKSSGNFYFTRCACPTGAKNKSDYIPPWEFEFSKDMDNAPMSQVYNFWMPKGDKTLWDKVNQWIDLIKKSDSFWQKYFADQARLS